eukprot:354823-Chlamydomonas_euryale.AAC.4
MAACDRDACAPARLLPIQPDQAEPGVEGVGCVERVGWLRVTVTHASLRGYYPDNLTTQMSRRSKSCGYPNPNPCARPV